MSSRQQPNLPLYQQVATLLRARLVNLDGQPPTTLPDERELAATYNAARGTIRRALDVLVEEGLIKRTRGHGTVSIPANIRTWRRMRQARTIHVVTSWQSPLEAPASFYGQMFQGILVQADRAGYSVSTVQMTGPFPEVGPSYQQADPKQVLGVIIAGVFDERVIAMHVDAGYPVVCVDHWTTNPQADAVVVDCFGEGHAAVKFLLRQGHRELFFLGNIPGPGVKRQHERDADLMLAGCRHALESSDLLLPDDHIRFCNSFNAATGKADDVAESVRWFASLQPRPTAGIIFSSRTLTTFRKMLADVGLACPNDVSLIGKAYVGEQTDVTSLVTAPLVAGTAAVELLLGRASGRRQWAERVAIPSAFRQGTTVRPLSG